jgi:adenosine deaminase
MAQPASDHEPATDTRLRDWIHRLPKTDLHIHLDGSIRPDTLIELAREYGKPLPVWDASSLRDYMYVTDARDLVDYLARFDITLSVLQTGAALERVAFEMVEDAAAESVRYMEVRFSPILNTRDRLSMHDAVDAVVRGLRAGEAQFGTRSGVIVCALRNMSPGTSVELARVAVDFKDRGVVAFDLAGPERGHPPAAHRDAFLVAARANLPVTVHAGEAFGPESIHQALHDCGARRIGHGTRLFEDPDLMAYVNDFRIPLEICLTSNVQTRVTESVEQHPVRRYYDAGLVVTLNTDNRLMSGTTVTDEFWRAHLHLGFTGEQLRDVAMMGFESAFLPWREKQLLLRQMRAALTALAGPPAHAD